VAKTRLDQLLGRIESETLREQIAGEIATLTDRTKFGLVYEEHLPEQIRLPGVKPRRRSKVVHRSDSVDAPLRTVRKVAGQQVQLDDDTTVPVDDVVVVREYGEPLYPGLEVLERIDRGGDKPDHVLIEAENLHALEALAYTHAESVDCIYIDPPYNTGGDLIYNDRYVGKEDTYRHSLWLSFMARRLRLARKLLKRTGVIVVAIGDQEHHRLRMLLDRELGEKNFIANITWQGGGSSLSRFHAGGIDYMLIYARDMGALTEADVRWRVEKEGLEDVLAAASDAWERSKHDADAATKLLSSWWTKNKPKYDPGLGDNVKIDNTGTAVKVGDLGNSLYRPNLRYPVTDPDTGIEYPPPANGWAFRQEVMADLIAKGSILFGGTRPRLKTPLREMSMRSVMPSFYKDRRSASQHLNKVLGSKDFPFPKDVDVLARWLGIVTSRNPDAVVLDFFAGTGSTGEAVMALNAADGGRRQSILVTNNEVNEKTAKNLRSAGHAPGDPVWESAGIFEHVTRPRIGTVVTGVRPDGSVYSDGLEENVTIAKLTYLDRTDVERAKAFTQIANLLWLQAGAHGVAITAETDDFAAPEGAHYAICFNVDHWEPFVEAVNAREDITHAYVVTDAEESYRLVLGRLRADIRARRLYENYLTNFTTNTPR